MQNIVVTTTTAAIYEHENKLLCTKTEERKLAGVACKKSYHAQRAARTYLLAGVVQGLHSSSQFKRISLQIYDQMMNVAKLSRARLHFTQPSSDRPTTLSIRSWPQCAAMRDRTLHTRAEVRRQIPLLHNSKVYCGDCLAFASPMASV